MTRKPVPSDPTPAGGSYDAARPALSTRSRLAATPKAIAFGVAVGFVVLFWLAGQASTLRWQVHHLLAHRPEVEGEPRPGF